MDDARTPTACPISQISQRASSRPSGSPNTAALTSLSIAADAIAASSWTVTLPSRTVTESLKGLSSIWLKKVVGVGRGRKGRPAAGVLPLEIPPRVALGKRIPLLLRVVRAGPAKQ